MKFFIFLILIITLSCDANNNGSFEVVKKIPDNEIALLSTSKGDIKLKFFPTKAPKTVNRIKELIGKGFYNGIQFHRVIPNFVIQAGDPTGTGVGGSGNKIKAEFNDELHVKGTVAMARQGHDENSADSQFYIALSTLPHLDNKYTIFGKVINGIEVLNKIKKGDQIISFKIIK
jgi:cyclophilin family peptidyl-prolyl cis-trans isomerase